MDQLEYHLDVLHIYVLGYGIEYYVAVYVVVYKEEYRSIKILFSNYIISFSSM